MRLAIEQARLGIEQGQTPFGCAVAMEGKLVAACHNTVLATTDITAHAEINALRMACRSRCEILLPGSVIATTCEPCPMCAAALHWARVETVYFGATIADATDAGFNELSLSASQLYIQGGSEIRLIADTLQSECRELFTAWKKMGSSGY